MAKVLIWDESTAKRKMAKQLKDGLARGSAVMKQCEYNEATVYPSAAGEDVRVDFDDLFGSGSVDSNDISINYTFKNLRFLHAQMSANPPVVIPRPTSSDNEDSRKADAADRIIRYAMRQYALPEFTDKLTLNTLLYGFGFIKVFWDGMAGDVAEFDPATGEIEMTGDISIRVPHVRDIVLDDTAKCWEDVRYLFERITPTLEEAMFRWPDKADILKKAARKNREGTLSSYRQLGGDEVIELWEYHERGMPINGMAGRFSICLEDGTPIEPVRPHPNRFTPPLDKIEKAEKAAIEAEGGTYRPVPPTAFLPYGYLSDIDVPDNVYGKSFVEYSVRVQDAMNRLDSATLDNLESHGVTRLVLPEGCEVEDDSITNSPWDILRMSGSTPPFFMENMQLPPDMSAFREKLKEGEDDVAGVNPSMFGQMNRETAGFALQYATNEGNLIRRRLFNKYVTVVEWMYKSILQLVRKHWTIPHTIKVLGSEHAYQSYDIKGSDIDGGYDFVSEYGSSLSLDPLSRREEIMNMMPMFEKAGVDGKTLLKMLKLNELEGMYDMMELSQLRQSELFEEMIETGKYIAPEELQEHTGMLEYAYRFVMSSEFKYLPEHLQEIIKQHIFKREKLAAEGAGAPVAPGAPGPDPTGGLPPVGMAGAPPVQAAAPAVAPPM